MQSAENQDETFLVDIPELKPVCYKKIIVGADASHHSNRAIKEAIELGQIWQSEITGAHVYAAKLHDRRFRQMEGGLPEEFKEENELERQRDIHDQLITKGLSIITDSYLDQAEKSCIDAGLKHVRCSLEGKNYHQMVLEANNGKYDLMVLGSLGLGATQSSIIGTVCERVVRRSNIDMLIIKQPERELKQGPIVVAVDGSKKSFGGLITGLTLAKQWRVPLHVISAYDPYYHYVAFNSIANVLSDEAGKIFRFKEQEKLHEDIIDAGLAKIYQGHLQISESIADEFDYPITTKLLDGKPHDVIEKYVQNLNASLLIIGKLGVHADDELDIGGNAENLLRNVSCALLIGQKEYTPEIEIIAEATTSWTNQAEERMKNIPSFAQGMARSAILRFAQEQGHTVVTEKIVAQATEALCPVGMVANNSIDEKMRQAELNASPKEQIESINPNWEAPAEEQLNLIKEDSLRDNIRHRAEKKARQEKSEFVTIAHLKDFLNLQTKSNLQPENSQAQLAQAIYWETAALARLNRVPEGFMRTNVKSRAIEQAECNNIINIDLDFIERIIEQANKSMKQQIQSGDSQCPFKNDVDGSPSPSNQTQDNNLQLNWLPEAMQSLQKVPAGTIRAMAKKATETIALEAGIETIDSTFFANILSTFQAGSQSVEESLQWTDEARAGISKAPPVVRGMLIKEIENLARKKSFNQVDLEVVTLAKQSWDNTGYFHLDDNDVRSAQSQTSKNNNSINTTSKN